jgi:hypothetical protein
MEAKEKAKELVEKYFSELRMPSDCDGCMQCVDRCGSMVSVAKQYALIAVDEIVRLDIFNCNCEWSDEDGDTREYWREVKQEIEKL